MLHKTRPRFSFLRIDKSLTVLKVSLYWHTDDDFLFLCVSTILVEPSCVARLTDAGDLCISVAMATLCVLGTELNTVQLSIFSHRFMSIAGETQDLFLTTAVILFCALVCCCVVQYVVSP